MVSAVSGTHGHSSGHIAPQNDYLPTVAQSSGLEHDTFEHGGHHDAHGHGGHEPVTGNWFERMVKTGVNRVKEIFWDAVSLPKVMWNKLVETFTGHHEEHVHTQEPFLPQQGFLSGNLHDHSMTRDNGPNEFLAKKGFLSGDLNDESGLYDSTFRAPL